MLSGVCLGGIRLKVAKASAQSAVAHVELTLARLGRISESWAPRTTPVATSALGLGSPTSPRFKHHLGHQRKGTFFNFPI